MRPRHKASISQEIESSAIVVAPIELHSRISSLAQWDLNSYKKEIGTGSGRLSQLLAYFALPAEVFYKIIRLRCRQSDVFSGGSIPQYAEAMTLEESKAPILMM